jgi:hypothetical protein
MPAASIAYSTPALPPYPSENSIACGMRKRNDILRLSHKFHAAFICVSPLQASIQLQLPFHEVKDEFVGQRQGLRESKLGAVVAGIAHHAIHARIAALEFNAAAETSPPPHMLPPFRHRHFPTKFNEVYTIASRAKRGLKPVSA